MHTVPRTERRLVLVPRDEALVPACSKLEVLLPGALGRTGLQRFIGETYARIHGARIEHFARHLIGIRGRDAQWAAGVGYTVANEQALFLEQYLDRPIESEIARRCAQTVSRSRIVEVGNLAARSPGSARAIILRMAGLLHSLDLSWVVFTSTRTLLNSFARLELDPLPIAPADPQRLPDAGRNWGSYYATRPHIFAASIPAGFLRLRSMRALSHAA